MGELVNMVEKLDLNDKRVGDFMFWDEMVKLRQPLRAVIESVELKKIQNITHVYIDLYFEDIKIIISEIPTSLRFDDDADAIQLAMELSKKICYST
ncbi:hypothetical protein DRO97_06415 [Archaeoglobales archaeon]|nr:MAG: hypothetical protein DRO97_06415 [Archaeoglobales archaeon]